MVNDYPHFDTLDGEKDFFYDTKEEILIMDDLRKQALHIPSTIIPEECETSWGQGNHRPNFLDDLRKMNMTMDDLNCYFEDKWHEELAARGYNYNNMIEDYEYSNVTNHGRLEIEDLAQYTPEEEIIIMEDLKKIHYKFK